MSASKFPNLNSVFVPPVSQISDDHTGHSVQFYADDSFLLDDLSRFIGTALGAGDAAIVLATPAHREALERRLQARGLSTPSPSGKDAISFWMRQGRCKNSWWKDFPTLPGSGRFLAVSLCEPEVRSRAELEWWHLAKWWRCYGQTENTTQPYVWSNCGTNLARSTPFFYIALIPLKVLRRTITASLFLKSVPSIPMSFLPIAIRHWTARRSSDAISRCCNTRRKRTRD